MNSNVPSSDPIKLADIEISAVTPGPTGLVLEGAGPDRSDYRVEVHFDIPVDARTREVIGELLAQSEIRVWRRSRQRVRFKSAAARRRGPSPRASG